MFDPKKVFPGIAPIAWCNDDMPELGAENTFAQTVSEMALAGFTGCEIGNKFPKDPQILGRALQLRGLQVASCWFSSFLLTKSYAENKASFQETLTFLAAVGARRINVSEQSFSIQGKSDLPILDDHRHIMTEEEWDQLSQGLNQLGQISAKAGIRLCYHHHMGTVIQTAAETARLLERTDPALVSLCYDTGHFTFAGEDPLFILRKFPDRIGHVHLKDLRLGILAAARDEHLSFLDAIRRGVFTVPGDGDTDFGAVFRLLEESGYEGWLLVEAEQDPAFADPLKYALMARAFLREHAGI
ncbi:MAG: myo-inosose-2 dehydratase [Firmicutes bacterium]|nr:myo-inosose-2 dehydratase [Bacillota bacterium]